MKKKRKSALAIRDILNKKQTVYSCSTASYQLSVATGSVERLSALSLFFILHSTYHLYFFPCFPVLVRGSFLSV